MSRSLAFTIPLAMPLASLVFIVYPCASYLLCWVRLILNVSVRHSNISIIVGNLLLLQVYTAELRLGDGDEGTVDDKAALPSICSAEDILSLFSSSVFDRFATEVLKSADVVP